MQSGLSNLPITHVIDLKSLLLILRLLSSLSFKECEFFCQKYCVMKGQCISNFSGSHCQHVFNFYVHFIFSFFAYFPRLSVFVFFLRRIARINICSRFGARYRTARTIGQRSH